MYFCVDFNNTFKMTNASHKKRTKHLGIFVNEITT